jgi:ATP/maltotriose-dependent transcriptional regulator MalT
MELIERDSYLDSLDRIFSKVEKGYGHCVLISGEAGIGKTSVAKAFVERMNKNHTVLWGTCDALFTPRPLAPLYDAASQLQGDFWQTTRNTKDRAQIFMHFWDELNLQKNASVIVFEDIHWADEATLDFIKFFARRITRLRCFFLLTYRDDEIHAHHPLRNVLGQLPTDSFTRLQLSRLSREVVSKMAHAKGYNAEEVYSITHGIPFYVNEILSGYTTGVPDNIKDAILNTYNRLNEKTKRLCDLLSVMPASLETRYLKLFDPDFFNYLDDCIDVRILFIEEGRIFFKHELFRRAIEMSLPPLKKISLNKWVLDALFEILVHSDQIERIVHHAKNANEYDIVVRYAPDAAAKAALVGSHVEAAKLWLTAIEYYHGNDIALLAGFCEQYAYECYLTNNIKEAIVYAGKTLKFLRAEGQTEKIGNCIRFLSRLWWLDGNRLNAEKFAKEAIEVLSAIPPSGVTAMAYSNMAQLKMLMDEASESMIWGLKAIELGRQLNNAESLAHALNNVGSLETVLQPTAEKGVGLLQESLAIALGASLHEHGARAYSNMASGAMELKNYSFARRMLDEGIQYCEERDLDSWRTNMLSVKATLNLETGDWKQALNIAKTLVEGQFQTPSFYISSLIVVSSIKMRTTDEDVLPLLLEARSKAFKAKELQRMIPSIVALLEYEWLTGRKVIEDDELAEVINGLERSIYKVENNRFSFWLFKSRKQLLNVAYLFEGYNTSTITKIHKAASLWKRLGCEYYRALVLYDGTDENKRTAIKITQELGATRTCDKFKREMRMAGIKGIPRGYRKSTQMNTALLTIREIEVLQLLKEGMKNKEIAAQLFISAKTVDHHISSILFKLDVNSRGKAVKEALRQSIIS